MAKTGGLGDNFYIGGYDLSGDVSTLSKISGGPALLDVTPINALANVRIGGLRTGEIDFTTFFDAKAAVSTPGVPGSGTPVVSTYSDPVLVTVIGGTGTQVNINGVNQGTFDGTYVLPALGTIILTYTVAPTWSWVQIGGEHEAESGLPTADVVASYFRGTAIGNPCASCIGKQINYDPTRGADGSISFAVQVMSNGFGLEWGTQLTPGARTDLTATAASSANSYNSLASASFGGQAYLQLLGFVGTSVDVSIWDSADNVTFLAVSGLDFGALSAVGSSRLAISNTSTIRQYIAVATTGTFTYAKFAVQLTKNTIAGQVF